jgi:hypothetical protein
MHNLHTGRSKFESKTGWSASIVEFLAELQEKLAQPESSVKIWTWHKPGEQTFCGHPDHRGKEPWKDWMWVNWGSEDGKKPAHVWCFVAIRNLPEGRKSINHGEFGLLMVFVLLWSHQN